MISQNFLNCNNFSQFYYYNLHKSPCFLTYLLVRLRINDKTESKRIKNYIYKPKPDSFWRPLSSSEVLPENQSALPLKPEFKILPAEQSLQHCRRNSGASLSHHVGFGEDRNVSSPQAQWGLSVFDGHSCLSQSNHLKTLSSSDGAPGTSTIKKPSRQDPESDASKAKTPKKNHSRSRFNGSYSLWKARTGRDRLQSDEKRSEVLPSSSLFQRHHEGLLARGVAARRYSHLDGDHRSAAGIFFQDSHLGQSHHYQGRQRFLRPQDHRIFGIPENSVCRGSQGDQAHQEEAAFSLLPFIYFGFRRSRVFIPTHKMEKEISFYRDPPAHSGGAIRTTQSFFHGPIQLPGDGDKFKTQTHQCLEVLQRQGGGGADHQGTQSRLSLGKDSDKTLRRQRDLFSFAPFWVQSHQLVQTTLLAKGISEDDA